MSDAATETAGTAGETRYNLLYRFLRLFTDIRRGEAGKALLLALNVFLILMPTTSSSCPGRAHPLGQESRDEELPRGGPGHSLDICRQGLQPAGLARPPAFADHLGDLVFHFQPRHLQPPGAHRGSDGTIGIIFYVWVGIFNLMVVAQFWASPTICTPRTSASGSFPWSLSGNPGAPWGRRSTPGLSSPSVSTGSCLFRPASWRSVSFWRS